MLLVIGSIQRGHDLYRSEYVPNGEPLRLESPGYPLRHAPLLHWFTGANFPQSYLTLSLSARCGVICAMSLIRADFHVDYDASLEACPIRIPGVPVCDISNWPREGQGLKPDLREDAPIGLAARKSTVQVSIVGATEAAIVYSSNGIDIGIDEQGRLAILQVNAVPEMQLKCLMGAVRQ